VYRKAIASFYLPSGYTSAMARPRFQISLRYVLLTLVPGVAITAAAVSHLARAGRAWVAAAVAYWLLAGAVLLIYYRRA
jgi:hypothetical protein